MQVHYLGNEGRGTVWEEIIINCPAHIQMLAMSATVANPDDLGSWITKVLLLPSTAVPTMLAFATITVITVICSHDCLHYVDTLPAECRDM